ncbi:MAG: hypothetical protein COC15_03585 [Legionellales bacterium]|nr:MAG: hypothetical protein COC15_03585 [Legionellales bacterium]
MSSLPLQNLNILVTRPEKLAVSLCQKIIKLGGAAYKLPTIQIIAIKNLELIPSNIYYAIFISQHAVIYGLKYLADHKIQVNKYIAIGASTAAILHQHSINSVLYPTQPPYNSTVLLELPELQNKYINNKNIVIFRGKFGLTTIADALKKRHAHVNNAIIYSQEIPDYTQNIIEQRIYNANLDLIIITSAICLHNLLELVNMDFNSTLKHIPLLVVGSRLQDIAYALGFIKVIVAIAATDQILISTLLTWRQQENT